MQYRTQLVKTPFGGIHTLEAGSGKPLVFLHGWSADAKTCTALLRCLATVYQVYIPTLPGWHPSYSLENEAGPTRAFVALGDWLDATGLHNITLLGHSLGGVAAIHLCAQRPEAVSRLVLIDAVGVPIARDHATWKKMWIQKRLRMYKAYGAKVVTRLDRALAKHALIRKRHLGRMSRYARTANILPLLETQSIPVEFLWGAEDIYTPLSTARTMAQHCKKSSITEVPGDHDWPLFTPEVLLDYLTTHAASNA
ncbi:MAG: alpha/beta hydrolase [Patescibacteria group bacterium]